MPKTTKDYTCLNLKDYVAKKGEMYIPTGAFELAFLAAKAYMSGETAEGVKYTKASLEALKHEFKDRGYECGLVEGDVMALVSGSGSKSPDSKGNYTISPEERYIERMVAFGRAKKVAAPKAKAKVAEKQVTVTQSAIEKMIADAVAKALAK